VVGFGWRTPDTSGILRSTVLYLDRHPISVAISKLNYLGRAYISALIHRSSFVIALLQELANVSDLTVLTYLLAVYTACGVVGTRYMVVDCGGGTVDITVYEMTSDTGKLKELYMATGGPYGSTGMYVVPIPDIV